MKSFGMSFHRQVVSMLVMAVLLVMAGFSYAAVEKENVAAKATTTSTQGASDSTVVIDGITLTVDQDYSWDTVMKTAGITAFDPNNSTHQKARAICLASDKAWAKYRGYRANSDFLNAEKYALSSLVRGWSAWNLACSRIGTPKDGSWSYDPKADNSSITQALKDLDRATNYASLCRDKKIGKNNVDQLLARIAVTTEYIKALDVLKR